MESEWELVDASGDPTTDPDADLPASAEGKVYKTHVGTDVDFNTLYVNDVRATLARTLNRKNENGFDSALTPYLRSAGGGIGDLIYYAGDLDEDSINGMVNAQTRGDLNASVYMWDGGYWDWMTDTIPISAIDTQARRLTYKTVEGHPKFTAPNMPPEITPGISFRAISASWTSPVNTISTTSPETSITIRKAILRLVSL